MRRIIQVLLFLSYFMALAACGSSAASAQLTASGTVETTEVNVAPELGGRVVQVAVIEGDTVKMGDVLVRLDDALLKAQRNIASANLQSALSALEIAKCGAATASTQYEIILNTALTRDMPTRTQDWYKDQNGNFTLPEWYYDDTEKLQAANLVVDQAATLLDDARGRLQRLQSQAAIGKFLQVESDLASAQVSFLVAENLYNRAWKGTDMDELTRRQLYLLSKDAYLESKDVESRWVTLNASVAKDLRDAAEIIYEDARQELEDAQHAYDDALLSDAAHDILRARAEVSMAEENLYTARDFARALETGIHAPAVTAAQRALDQANAVVGQANSAVRLAQASLDMLDLQLSRTVITAPVDGVVLDRSVEPGNVVNPGSLLLTLGRLEHLTITVYVPEDRLSEVTLGQSALVTVDSFSGERFSAQVSNIANQAEFTPKNVQTVEGRKSTVFAVELIFADTGGRLKPGMPADVVFGATP